MLDHEFKQGFDVLTAQWPKSYNGPRINILKTKLNKLDIDHHSWMVAVNNIISKYKAAPTPDDIARVAKKTKAFLNSRSKQEEKPEKKCEFCYDCGLVEVSIDSMDERFFCRCNECDYGKDNKWNLPMYKEHTGILLIRENWYKRWIPNRKERRQGIIGSDLEKRWTLQVERSKKKWKELEVWT